MLSAIDLARRIDTGELTPAAVIEICATAIAAHEKDIGAFAVLDLGRAKRAAEDSRLSGLPLRGLPVGIKDIFDTADFATEFGSPIYAGRRPLSDSVLVSMVRRAGGIILGKTVTTEFASLQPAGTRNPHNLAHSPGGSSSGSAAGVAAGMLPLAFGSQTGGSVIRPAAYCGVAGFKPSFKLLPTLGMKGFSWYLDTAGIFGAGVADVAFGAAAITGRDLRVDQKKSAPPRIALVRSHIWGDASAPMRQAVDLAAANSKAAGANVTEIVLPPIFEDAFRAHGTIQDYEAFRALAFEYDHHRGEMGPILRQQLDEAASLTVDAYDDARRITKRARQTLAELMADTDVLLTPSAPGAAPKGLSSTGASIFNRLWTLLGTPCVNVPGLVDDTGLPIGVQIVGRFGRDRLALEAALFLEGVIAG
jgi:Asp-tRNA(Asn)/Glu-tRNA(Gln) amidotransferase A subunit family amidase